jgi:hypothetical protein
MAAAAWSAYRFNARRIEVNQVLYGETGPKPTPEEAATLRSRLVAEAFITGGIAIVSFLILDWLF